MRYEVRNGAELYFDDSGYLHRNNDKPALIDVHNGYQAWYFHGQLHRGGDLPAVIESDGSKWWYQYGVLHRQDGSAVIYGDGTEEYYYQGKLHRDGDLPASIGVDEQYWFEDGLLHRHISKGPAVITKKYKAWYNQGNLIKTYGSPFVFKQKSIF